MDGSATDDPAWLLQRIALGDREAFLNFYERYKRAVFTFATRLLNTLPHADAEGLTQEIFLQVWRQAANYDRSRGSAGAWIMTMTRNRALDFLRRAPLERRLELLAPANDSDHFDQPQTEAIAGEEGRRVREALAQLPETQRQLIELAYYDGFTQAELARHLDIPLGTVKTRMNAALKRLRALLQAEAGGVS
jgi:RNA polymerase sigma-70 factor, ECF subfamily